MLRKNMDNLNALYSLFEYNTSTCIVFVLYSTTIHYDVQDVSYVTNIKRSNFRDYSGLTGGKDTQVYKGENRKKKTKPRNIRNIHHLFFFSRYKFPFMRFVVTECYVIS